VTLALALIAAAAAAQDAAPPPLAPPSEYKLVWSDEFDRGGLPDPAKWDYDTAFNRRGWHNEE
jgi:hypothetical protein